MVSRAPGRLLWPAVFVLFLAVGSARAGERLVLNFNPDWKFTQGDPPGASAPGFDDRGWQTVSTPHTYNDRDTFDDWSLPGLRGEQNLWSGRTWYRKIFTPPAAWRGRRVYLEFGAVRQVAEIYLNGHDLGACKNGFLPFGFDLTPHLEFGRPNVLAVMCDNRFIAQPMTETGSLASILARTNARIPESVDAIQADQIPWNDPRWHPPLGGIYRDVRLIVTGSLHITLPLYSFLRTAGPYVWAGDISSRSATIHVEVPVANDRTDTAPVAVSAEILDGGGRTVLTLRGGGSLAAGATRTFALAGALDSPRLWEPDDPYLYQVAISLSTAGAAVDTDREPLGIRTVHWDVATGFWINGHPLKLHGWGQRPTDEWPGLGTAQPDWMHCYTLELMKQAGGNFIRWGHCAGGPAMIAAGDRLGLICDQPGVDGESDTVGAAWQLRAEAFRDLIVFYRNHPSILIWEGGNQKVTRAHAAELRHLMDEYDPHGGRAYAHRRADATTAAFMDVDLGTEGGHEIARLPVVEAEYDREESPRRVWDDFSPPDFGYPAARGQTYDLTSEHYAVDEVTQYVRKLGAPGHCGGANWIFSDSTSGGRNTCEVDRASGEVDGVRLPKEAYYVCAAMFRSDPQVHIIGHWTYPPGTIKTIYVVSNCDRVRLFVNRRPLGDGRRSDRYLFTFAHVAWQPGELSAVAYRRGAAVATDTRQTAGPPVALRLTPIVGPGGLRAAGSDVVLIDVEAVDAQGERCPTFQRRVDFTCDGPGVWRGGYNSGKIHSINHRHLDLECGINRVAVRSTRVAGAIAVAATCPGLKSARVVVTAHPFAVHDGYSDTLPAMPAVALPAAAPRHPPLARDWASQVARAAPASPRPGVGRSISSFSYSGPNNLVHVETDARDGKNVYVDRDYPFAGLPSELTGSDWVQGADDDSLYSALDLMEIAVRAGTTVYVAHDDRVARPAWLEQRFRPTDQTLTVHGVILRVYARAAVTDESLTLGANTDDPTATTAQAYVVFVQAAP